MIPQTNELTPKFCSGEFGAQLIEAHQLVEHLHHYYIVRFYQMQSHIISITCTSW